MPLTTEKGICKTCGADRNTTSCPDCSSYRSSVISSEVENLLINIAQILDVVKTEWGNEWSEFDQQQRDHITKLLRDNDQRTAEEEEGIFYE